MQNGDIRLMNGTAFYENYVEICWNETCGTFCDGFWSEVECYRGFCGYSSVVQQLHHV